MSPLSFLILVIWVLNFFLLVYLKFFLFCWSFQGTNFWSVWFALLFSYSLMWFPVSQRLLGSFGVGRRGMNRQGTHPCSTLHQFSPNCSILIDLLYMLDLQDSFWASASWGSLVSLFLLKDYNDASVSWSRDYFSLSSTNSVSLASLSMPPTL